MSAPDFSSPRVSAVLAARSRPAAGAAHSADAPPDSSTSTRSSAVAVPTSASVRSAASTLLASGVGWRAEAMPITRRLRVRQGFQGAMRRRGEAGDAIEHAELAIVPLGRRRHGGSGLAGADDDQSPASRHRRQMRRQADFGMRRGHRRIVQRQEPRACVNLSLRYAPLQLCSAAIFRNAVRYLDAPTRQRQG